MFELSIIRMLVNSCGRGVAEKCVYVAPTKVCPLASFEVNPLKTEKALCAERTRDWTEKFGPLGMKCMWRHSSDVLTTLISDRLRIDR